MKIFAYNLMRGRWEIFPYQYLRKIGRHKAAIAYYACMPPADQKFLNEWWYLFKTEENTRVRVDGTTTAVTYYLPEADQ